MIVRRSIAALFAGACLLAVASQACAWGSSGHRFISRAAILALPSEVPAFLCAPETVAQIGELGREPDRSRGAGQPHDADLDPGHFIDLSDDGQHIFSAQGPVIDALPRSHADYIVALSKAGIDPAKAGYLPYNIEDGYEQLVKDFAYWRIDNAMAKRATDPRERAWYAGDLKLRQAIIIRDLGYWSHFVADASMPMHASVHYNGWGDYPNPNNYTQDKIHGPFEGEFVRANLSLEAVQHAMTPYADCGATIQDCMVSYIKSSQAMVEPLYKLWGAGGFQPGDARGKAFALERVANAASELRDMVLKAWRTSADAGIGRPIIYARDVEAGRNVLFTDLYGDD